MTEQRRAEADRSALYQQLVAQQNRVDELIDRLALDHERLRQRLSPAAELEHLSDRERQILRLLAAGLHYP